MLKESLFTVTRLCSRRQSFCSVLAVSPCSAILFSMTPTFLDKKTCFMHFSLSLLQIRKVGFLKTVCRLLSQESQLDLACTIGSEQNCIYFLNFVCSPWLYFCPQGNKHCLSFTVQLKSSVHSILCLPLFIGSAYQCGHYLKGDNTVCEISYLQTSLIMPALHFCGFECDYVSTLAQFSLFFGAYT